MNTAEYLKAKCNAVQSIRMLKATKAVDEIRIQQLKQKNQTVNSIESSDTKTESKQGTNARLGESLKRKWESKVMHGQCIRSVDRHLIGEEDTSGVLKGD